MTLAEIKEHVMFQTNNDAEDVGDFLPALGDYINDGYDRLVFAWCGEHVTAESDDWTKLRSDKSSPALPDWTHRAIADFATWLVYRNGSLPKQNRGLRYLESFNEILSRIQGMTDAEKGLTDESGKSTATHYGRYITNIPW